MYKIRKALSVSDKDNEILTNEIISKESKDMLLSCCYMPPKGITENLTNYLTSICRRAQNKKKKSFIIGDFDLNCFNDNEDSNMNIFTTKCLSLGFVPLIDKSARICKSSATIIDNTLTNYVFNNKLKKSIIKSDISDHFPIIFAIQTEKKSKKMPNPC